jgi:hypothetical protein
MAVEEKRGFQKTVKPLREPSCAHGNWKRNRPLRLREG